MFRKIHIQLICIAKTRNGKLVASPCLKATTAGKAWYWQWGKWPSCTEYYMWHRQGQWRLLLILLMKKTIG